MDRWAPLLPDGWCSQAMDLIRSRYMISEITAILELGCPLDTSAPSHPPRSGSRTDRKRRRRAMAIIPYDDVLQAQTARSSPVLAESVASKWFQSTLCSIREKELAVAHMDRTPDKDQLAAQLMRAALAKQKALLEEQRSAWRELHPSTVDHDRQ
jgi:hypothetical protein